MDDKSYAIHVKKQQKKKFDLSKESLCSFLNSSLNVEYVYLILVGI